MTSTEKKKLEQARTALLIAQDSETVVKKDMFINTALTVLNDLLEPKKATFIDKIKKAIPVPTDPTIKEK